MDNADRNNPTPQDQGRKKRTFAGFVTLLLLMVSFPSGAADFADREYDDAVRSFKIGRASEAFGKFIDLANRGDVDAARIALFMSQYDSVLFGKHWGASPAEIGYWTLLVKNSGSTARPQPEFMPSWLARDKAERPRATNVKNVSAMR